MSISNAAFMYSSDKVPARIIRAVTDKCPRNDCQISAQMGESTTMGTPAEFYDKNGMLIIEDGNKFQVTLCCRTCWTKHLVDHTGTILETAM